MGPAHRVMACVSAEEDEGLRTCVIFLDVDGVLNVRTRSGRDFTDLRPEIIANLRELMVRTGAKIVLSTSWRHDEDLMEVLFTALARRGSQQERYQPAARQSRCE